MSKSIKTEIIKVRDVEVIVTRKAIKNIHLRVYPPDGQVKASVPAGISSKTIGRFLEDKYAWIKKQQEAIAGMEKVTCAALTEDHRKALLLEVTELVKKWEPVIGVKAEEIRIRKMRTRWGTCNITKKRIWFSLYLALKPLECVEYVVVHELVHLLERGHNKVFYGYMDSFLPDWKERRKILNREGMVR